tara:strand:+ start:313 stop:1164 length:852 start_codon:yes stop_codon:yes gene_type:complete
MNIKHSKYKNSGILFELLVRQITSDTLNGNDSPARKILKNYFVKTELGKEYKLYEILSKSINLTEAKATTILETILESSKTLNRSSLKRQKYNLVKEIKNHYDVDKFFKHKLPNYKSQAALYTLIEIQANPNLNNIKHEINNKLTLIESISENSIKKDTTPEILNEFKNYDSDLRILTYRVLLEKFNSRYDGLNEDQKGILKELILSVDNTPRLKEFYNSKVADIKTKLLVLNKEVTDKTTQIKINEVVKILPLNSKKSNSIKDEDLINLLQYYGLIEELENV